MARLTMQEWTHTEFYQQMIQEPLWLHCAFGSLKEGDIIPKNIKNLICSIVLKIFDKCPYYDTDYRNEWKTSEYIEIVKSALKATSKCIL